MQNACLHVNACKIKAPQGNRGISRNNFMNYRRNKKYFEQVNTVYPIIISAALIAVGFIMVVFLAGTRGLPRGLMMMIGFPLLVAGIILGTTISAIRIKDSEIDEVTVALREDFGKSFCDKFVNIDVRRHKNEQRYGDHSANDVFLIHIFLMTTKRFLSAAEMVASVRPFILFRDLCLNRHPCVSVKDM